ncbi:MULTISPECIES: phage tail tube protein [unclassified Sinorhizobium]|uniref:phage tail tube protein n=1 Tax=unclassified Sinorhizobium TaxID=2613772 RepID=UPI0024C39A47|nr:MULTISPECIES: phage tail tube protein [unclassified Sinorhizobium]MDK1372952.1 phage tail tube protein [Sinorhizobium sp. 6-70]MDK1477492.1 phage tail tube protein [Sinorhizobium sp. 6-117]
MAKPKTARFGAFAVMLGSGTGPITYAAPCGFTSKSLALSKELSEIVIPDCTAPDAASWVGRDVTSLSAAVNGEGVLAEESVEDWLSAYNSTAPVPVKIVLTLSTETIEWVGTMHVASLNIEAEQGGRVTLNVEMQSDGEMVQAITPVP